MKKNDSSWRDRFSVNKHREVIYGVTDRSKDPFFVSLNEWMIDRSFVKDKEKELLYSSLELLIRSGVRFTRAIHLLAKRTKNERLRRILKTIAYDMENRGMSFSSSMAKYPDVFDSSESKMMYAGEVTGKLEQTLGTISQQIQRNLHLRMQIKSALAYPIVVVCTIVLAIVVVLQFVVPKLAEMFQEFGADLPMATKALLWMSEFFQAYWWVMIAGMALFFSLFQAWKNTHEGSRVWDGWWLKAPLVGTIVNNIQTVRVAGNLATLLESGLPVPKAFHLLSEMIPNKVIGDALFTIENRLINGDQMHECFKDNPVFDEVLGEVIEVGETGGNVSEILEKTSRQYQMELDNQLKNLMTILEPLIIVLVGGAVIVTALALLVPLFELTALFASG